VQDNTIDGKSEREEMLPVIKECLAKQVDVDTLTTEYLKNFPIRLRHLDDWNEAELYGIRNWCVEATAPNRPLCTFAKPPVLRLNHDQIETLIMQLQQVSHSFVNLLLDAIVLFDKKISDESFVRESWPFTCNFLELQHSRQCMLAEYPRPLQQEQDCAGAPECCFSFGAVQSQILLYGTPTDTEQELFYTIWAHLQKAAEKKRDS
jgi:hypothetical protein